MAVSINGFFFELTLEEFAPYGVPANLLEVLVGQNNRLRRKRAIPTRNNIR